MLTVLTSVANAVASENSASSEATVSVPPLPSNSSRTVSTAGLAVSVSTRSRKSSTLSSTRRALLRPMSSCSWPSTDVATSSAGNSVSTAKKAVSAASPSSRSRSALWTISTTMRTNQSYGLLAGVRAASRAVTSARSSEAWRLVTLVGISGSGRTRTRPSSPIRRARAVRTG